MMLLHCTASSSTFGAHPHHRQCPPNLNLMVRTPPRNLMNSMLPWMVKMPSLNWMNKLIFVMVRTPPLNLFVYLQHLPWQALVPCMGRKLVPESR